MIYKIIVNSDILESLQNTLHKLALQGSDLLHYQVDSEDVGLTTITSEDEAGLNGSVVDVLISSGVSHDMFTVKKHDDGYADLTCTQYRLEKKENIYDLEMSLLAGGSSTSHQYLRLAALSGDSDFIEGYFKDEQGKHEEAYWSFYTWLLDPEPKGIHLPVLSELYRFRYNENLSLFSAKVESLIDKALSHQDRPPSPS